MHRLRGCSGRIGGARHFRLHALRGTVGATGTNLVPQVVPPVGSRMVFQPKGSGASKVTVLAGKWEFLIAVTCWTKVVEVPKAGVIGDTGLDTQSAEGAPTFVI